MFKIQKLTNKDKIEEYHKGRYEANRKNILEKNKVYYEKNKEQISEKNKQKVKCHKCGCEVCLHNLTRHKKSKKCLNYNVNKALFFNTLIVDSFTTRIKILIVFFMLLFLTASIF